MTRSEILRVVLLSLLGTTLALALAADVHVSVGPFDTTMSARPSFEGETLVRLAPLGTIRLDTHDAPLAIEVRMDELRVDEAEAIARDPSVLRGIEDELAHDVRLGLLRLLLRSLIVGTLGGLLGVVLLRRAVRALTIGGVVALGSIMVVTALTAGTWRPESVNEPRYSGLLTVAPRAVGDAERVFERFGEYRAQLADFVGNVVTLYRAADRLPEFDPGTGRVRLLHVSDVHNNPQAFDLMRRLVDGFDIDAVVDTGDTSDWGTDPEAQLLTRIGELQVPYVWVRGNHDSSATQAAVAAQPNAVVLDGQPPVEVAGLRLWGVGDPRYTPDKQEGGDQDDEREVATAFADDVAGMLSALDPAPDVALVHDPRVAAKAGGLAPLVLAGHTHEPRRSRLGESLLLVQGSTGGAGLRALKGDEVEPLTCAVLYLDAATRRLLAYDQVTVEGLGRTGVRITRHVVR